MLSSRSSTLALIAALAMAGGAPIVLASQPAMTSAAPVPVVAAKRNLFGGGRLPASRYGRKGAGLSVAQAKRISVKKRNVVRNRANHR